MPAELKQAAAIDDVLESTDTSDFEGDVDLDEEDPGAGEVAAGGGADDDEERDQIDDDSRGEIEIEVDEPLGGDDAVARDEKGRFAAKEKEDADKAAAAAGDKAGDKPAGDAPAAKAADDKPPTWEPYVANVNKEKVPVEGLEVSAVGDFMVMKIPKAQYGELQTHISRGILAPSIWRQLDAERKQFDAEKALPQAKSDAEVEADLTLTFMNAALKTMMETGEPPTQMQLDILERDVKLAQIAERDRAGKARTEAIAAANKPAEDETAELQGLASVIVDVIKSDPDFASLTKEEAQAVYNDLVDIRRSVYWKEADGWKYNPGRIKKTIAATIAARPKPAAAPANGAPSKEHTAAADAKGGKGAADRADQLNRGHESAAEPGQKAGARTTNLKANRDGGNARPSKEHTRAAADRSPEPVSKQVKAEDDFRGLTRRARRSATLDFD